MSEVEYAARALFDVMTVDLRKEVRELRRKLADLEGRGLRDVVIPDNQDDEKGERYLNQSEAAAFLGCSREFIRQRRREGTFPKPVRLSARDLRWPISALEKWLREQGES